MKGSQYYDDKDFFQNYLKRRSAAENPNDTIEKPIFKDLVGDVSKLKVLDLGCGNGKIGRELLELGCESYLGIEGSKNMAELAKVQLSSHPNGNVLLSPIEDWNFPVNQFDLVISRLVIHYLEDIEMIFQKISGSLVKGGRFIFSVEHPVITSTLQTSGQRTSWVVDHYFKTGMREQDWLGAKVYKYHRTIEDYFSALQRSGFIVESLKESLPRRENFIHNETFERRLRIPLFLFLAARKE